MSIPIKVALLWHQHQPYYEAGGVFRLPWVRLHATKDYLEMAEHLRHYPAIHTTINLVPSLLEQLEEYAGGMQEQLLQACRKPAGTLSDEERAYVSKYCRMANYERMVTRSVRYKELVLKQEALSDQELLDLIVLFHLAWSGEFLRVSPLYKTLIAQDKNFSEEQKQHLLDVGLKAITSVIDSHKELESRGHVELSCTPFYHPILPLLCSTDSAKDATPAVILPPLFSAREDASEQVRRAIESHTRHFGHAPNGMWLAEGSMSFDALSVLAEHKIRWTASDEAVLHNSLSESERQYGDFEKYFLRRFGNEGDGVFLFFRDHALSDKIGFDYQHWDASDAVADFIGHIKNIRSGIIERFSEEVVESACVSIILDGENCWEGYSNNGFDFLSAFYRGLSDEEEIKLVTFSEAVAAIGIDHIRGIGHICAGSWINGNFRVWIGDAEKNRAWELLTQTREHFNQASADAPAKAVEEAYSALLKAEGSDWFWWLEEGHHTSDQALFDELFRSHLRDVYVALGLPVPPIIDVPIGMQKGSPGYSAMRRAKSVN